VAQGAEQINHRQLQQPEIAQIILNAQQPLHQAHGKQGRKAADCTVQRIKPQRLISPNSGAA